MLTFYDDNQHKVGVSVEVPYAELNARFVAMHCKEWTAKYALYLSNDGVEFHVYTIKYDDNFCVSRLV